MSHVSRVLVQASQSISIAHPVQQLVITNGLPNWLYIRVGGSDLPTASNADIAVAPLSMGAFPIVPTRNFGIAVGDVTILAVTNVPITQAVCMFYEDAQPVTLGQVPLSPGGFRYRKILNQAATLTSGSSWQVDLSNFTFFRYIVSTPTSGVWWTVAISSVSSTVPAVQFQIIRTFIINTNGSLALSGIAGSVLLMFLNCQDSSGNPASITLTDQMEAW